MLCNEFKKRYTGVFVGASLPSYQIKALHTGTFRFEISVDVGCQNYLVILGEHINGLFCCIPNHRVSCEIADPRDILYNTIMLRSCDIQAAHAEAIADAICKTAVAMYDFLSD